MSRFQKLSHVIWHCQYHIVWIPELKQRPYWVIIFGLKVIVSIP